MLDEIGLRSHAPEQGLVTAVADVHSEIATKAGDPHAQPIVEQNAGCASGKRDRDRCHG
jgi:hypothetical protein